MILRKWSYKRHDYLPYVIPNNWHVMLYADRTNAIDMDTECNCAACGKKMKFGDGYTSLVIHTTMGLGYTVCPECHEKEMAERLKQRS